MKYTCKSLDELRQCVYVFLGSNIRNTQNVRGQASNMGAKVVGLRGDLGSGKTTFTQMIAKELGIEMPVLSPTFVLERIYKIEDSTCLPVRQGLKIQDFKYLIHIDAYRLESADELKHLGWDDIASDPGNLILIEWPERVASAMPADMIYIDFKFVDETTREISW